LVETRFPDLAELFQPFYETNQLQIYMQLFGFTSFFKKIRIVEKQPGVMGCLKVDAS
jgi:hypothetical protein